MNEVEAQVVSAQTAEAGLARLHDMVVAGVVVVVGVTDDADLGDDLQVLPAEVLEGAAQLGLHLVGGVDFGHVEGSDAQIQALAQETSCQKPWMMGERVTLSLM